MEKDYVSLNPDEWKPITLPGCHCKIHKAQHLGFRFETREVGEPRGQYLSAGKYENITATRISWKGSLLPQRFVCLWHAEAWARECIGDLPNYCPNERG